MPHVAAERTHFKKIEPLNDWVFVQRLVVQDSTLIKSISDTSENSPYCRVLAVGPGTINENGITIPMHSKPDDLVYIAKWSGMDLSDIVDNDGNIMKDVFLARQEVVMMTCPSQTHGNSNCS